jgi:hypothetical protein
MINTGNWGKALEARNVKKRPYKKHNKKESKKKNY